MSNVIHMETELARQTAAQIVQSCEQLDNYVQSLSRAVRGIPWEGPGRDRYVTDFSNLIQRLTRLADDGRGLGIRLQREVDEWLGIDSSGGQEFENILTTIGIYTVPIGMAFQDLLWGFMYADFKDWWSKLSMDDKLAYLNEQERKIAERFGFPPVPITMEDLPDLNGNDSRGVNRGNAIVIDKDNLNSDDPWRLIETAAHETRHQFQRYAVDLYKSTGKVPDHVTEEQVKAWTENEGNYKDGNDDFESYWDQPIEQDARDFGGSYMQEVLNNKDWGPNSFPNIVPDSGVYAGASSGSVTATA